MLIVLLYCATIFGAEAQSLQFKTYSVNDGLVSRHVRRIFQDSKGFLWIGTWEGLSKYDGARFLNFTPANGFPGNLVNDIYEDEAGRLLVAVNDGSVVMIQADTVVYPPVFTDIVVNQFAWLDKKIYAGTDDKGIRRLSDNKFVHLNGSGNDYYFLNTLDDSLLATGGPSGFEIMQRTGQTVFALEKIAVVNNCLADAQNRIWIGTDVGLRLVQFFPKSPQQTRLIPLPSSINGEFASGNAIHDLLMDHQENIWIASDKGLLCYRKDGTASVYANKSGLPSAFVYCLYQDREKNIWIGTGQGLARLVTKNNYRQWTSSHGLSADVTTNVHLVSPAALLITSIGGVQLYDTVANKFSTIKTDLLPLVQISANKRNPLLYNSLMATNWDIQIKKLKFFLFPHAYRRDIDDRGWIYSCDGAGRIFVTVNNKTYQDSLGAIRLDQLLADSYGYLWVGTWSNGVYRIRYSIENGKLKRDLRDFNASLPAKLIRSFFEDKKGNIWVGTRNDGVYVLTKKENDQYNITHYGTKEGISSSWVRCTAEDNKGNIWMGTYGGLDKLIPTKTGFRVFNFSRINDISAGINDIALSGSTIWCASNEGMLRFTDDHLDTLSAPPLWITSCSIAGRLTNAATFKTDSLLHLKAKENTVAFSFSAGSLLNEKTVSYSYRLLSVGDTSWSIPANVHSVNYASLRPGHYRFEVRSYGLNGEPGEARLFSFVIHPPFTQTPLFYLLCVMALGVIGFALYRYRISQIMRLQKVRSQIATDLHDEIGSSLTNIGLLSAIVEKNIHEEKETRPFLHRIREDIKTSAQALDDIIWSVNVMNDSTPEMLARMRRYASEIFESAEMKYELTFPQNETKMHVRMEQRRDIYLVFKEAVNNIIKHAEATAAKVEVNVKEATVCLTISDNGKGFVKGVSSHRNGLMNMEKRIVKWGGTISIKSDTNNGTTVKAEIPLQ